MASRQCRRLLLCVPFLVLLVSVVVNLSSVVVVLPSVVAGLGVLIYEDPVLVVDGCRLDELVGKYFGFRAHCMLWRCLLSRLLQAF